MDRGKIKDTLIDVDKRTLNERVERISFLSKLIGEERDVWMPQIPDFILKKQNHVILMEILLHV